MSFIFFLSLFFLIYHLFFYPLIIFMLGRKNKNSIKIEINKFPTITILCPAYNEVDIIEKKIHSFINLNYPKDKIKMIVISDDSTDGTNDIVNKYVKEGYIELIIQKPRKGKPSGHNLVEPTINSTFVLSTDSNSLFEKDSVRKMIIMINNNKDIGMVVGRLKLVKENMQDSGEGIFWTFESFLKIIDSRFKSVICANGSLFIIRRQFFTQINKSSVDDFERTLIVLENKKTVKYAPEAIVVEDVTGKPIEEMNRKIRIISREWFTLFRHSALLNPFKYPKISFLLFSHKIIRWLLFLWCTMILITNIVLFSDLYLYKVLFFLQLFFYFLGIVEINLEKNQKSIKLLKIPAYFLVMIYASFVGFIRFFKGKQVAMWDTARNNQDSKK